MLKKISFLIGFEFGGLQQVAWMLLIKGKEFYWTNILHVEYERINQEFMSDSLFSHKKKGDFLIYL